MPSRTGEKKKAIAKKPRVLRSDGVATRKNVLDTALALFREKGFAATTMREIASRAGLSLGAAYHYFPSKEAIVLAWYETLQAEHAALSRATLAAETDARARVLALFRSKIEVIAKNRELMAAVFRGVFDPDSPASVFAGDTAGLRRRAVGEFAEAISTASWPDAIRDVLPTALWAAHMAVLLYLLHDRSRGAAKTHKLAEASVDAVLAMARLGSMPGFEPMRDRLIATARDLGLTIDV